MRLKLFFEICSMKIFIASFAHICNYFYMEREKLNELSQLLKALGEYNRLSLVYELCGCEKPKGAMCLCECCSVDASVASRHLKALAHENIVKVEKRGRERLYSLNRTEVSDKLRELADAIDRGTLPHCHGNVVYE